MRNEVIVNKRDLYQALRRVKPFAGRDNTLPLLNAVHLYTFGGEVFVEATDRYRLLIRRVTHTMEDAEAPDGLNVIIALPDVTTLIGILKPTRGEPDSDVTITVEEAPASSQTVVSFALQWGGSGRFMALYGDYPPLPKLIPNELNFEAVPAQVVNAAYLKDLYFAGAESKAIVIGRAGKAGQLVFSTDPELEIGLQMGMNGTKMREDLEANLGYWSQVDSKNLALA